MKRLLICLGFALFFIPAQAQAQLENLTAAQQQRADAVASQLRCLVCQNESIEESSASLANQLRQIIEQQIVSGASNQQIKNYMVQRYGIFILLKPPVSPLTFLLYASPFLAFLIGGWLFYVNRRQRAKQLPLLDKAEQARLDELLK